MITILVVEDSARDRETYRKILSKLDDVKVLEAESGEAALELLKYQRVDILLLDVMLPGINGFQLANSLRTMPFYAMAPILFITGYNQEPLKAYRRYNCYDYIVKPFSAKELIDCIKKLICEIYISHQGVSPGPKRRVVQLVAEKGFISVVTDQIVVAEAHLSGVYLQLKKGDLYLPRTSLNALVTQVGEDFFQQCHRSFAVNVNEITHIEKVSYRLYLIHLKDQSKAIDVTKKFVDQIREAQCHCLAEKGDRDGLDE